MEFPFSIERFGRLSVWNGATMGRLNPQHRQQLETIIDKMGAASAKAQGLKQVITTATKIAHSDHRLYLATAQPNQCTGILKVGKKKLFIRDDLGRIREMTPLCVLDFYVHESMQRRGVGATLFAWMLSQEKIEPHMIAYDRPSPKLLSFLAKHHGLKSYTPQNNNFVVFRQYMEKEDDARSRGAVRRTDAPSRSSSRPSSSEHIIRYGDDNPSSSQPSHSQSQSSQLSLYQSQSSYSSQSRHDDYDDPEVDKLSQRVADVDVSSHHRDDVDISSRRRDNYDHRDSLEDDIWDGDHHHKEDKQDSAYDPSPMTSPTNANGSFQQISQSQYTPSSSFTSSQSSYTSSQKSNYTSPTPSLPSRYASNPRSATSYQSPPPFATHEDVVELPSRRTDPRRSSYPTQQQPLSLAARHADDIRKMEESIRERERMIAEKEKMLKENNGYSAYRHMQKSDSGVFSKAAVRRKLADSPPTTPGSSQSSSFTSPSSRTPVSSTEVASALTFGMGNHFRTSASEYGVGARSPAPAATPTISNSPAPATRQSPSTSSTLAYRTSYHSSFSPTYSRHGRMSVGSGRPF